MTNQPIDTPDICVVGLVYFEVHLPADALPEEPGTERFVEDLPVELGGALNTASVAAALGRRTHLAHPTGPGLTDAAVDSEIRTLQIETTTWKSEPDPAVSIVVARDGDRSFLSHAHHASLADGPELPSASWIHVPGLREAEALDETLRNARRAGARVSVAGSWAPEQLEELPQRRNRPWDLLVLNRKEYTRAVGTDAVDPSILSETAPDVVVTDGDEGVFAHIDGTDVHIEPEPVDPVDTTGAGDAFCAGYLDARLDDVEPAPALRHAARVAARIVERRGGVVDNEEWFANLERP